VENPNITDPLPPVDDEDQSFVHGGREHQGQKIPRNDGTIVTVYAHDQTSLEEFITVARVQIDLDDRNLIIGIEKVKPRRLRL
jgi:hypothetical protein